VIRFIATNTVPVAINLYVIRKQPDAAGDFFRNVQKQRPAQYQGLYLVAPDGKVLASHQNYKSEETWPRQVLGDLRPGMRAFGEVEARDVRRADPSPERGRGLRPDGGATLALYLRYSIQGIPFRELPNPTIDSLPLTADELAALGPAKAEEGTAWALPDELARKFSRLLGPGTEDTMPRPNEVSRVKLTGKVRFVEKGVALVLYAGELAGSHLNAAKKHTQSETRVTGVGRYDVKARRLLSFVWVCDGLYRDPPPYDELRRYSAVVEWRLDRPRE
jgi:hypothetical protein